MIKQGMGSDGGIIIRGLIILSRAMAFMGTGEGGGEEVVMGRRGASGYEVNHSLRWVEGNHNQREDGGHIVRWGGEGD